MNSRHRGGGGGGWVVLEGIQTGYDHHGTSVMSLTLKGISHSMAGSSVSS